MDKISPMLLRHEKMPFNSDKYLYEIKYDGVRMIADSKSGTFQLYNRNLNDRTAVYPELTDELNKRYCAGAVFDGEVIALGENGKPDFYKLMQRDRSKRLRPDIEIVYVIFDILFLNGKSLTDTPLTERKKILDKLVKNSKLIKKADVYSDGIALFETVKQYGLEGIVAKEKIGTYSQSERCGTWIKIKAVQRLSCFIGGYVKKSRVSVCLGVKTDDGLKYVGNAGTGLDEKDFSELEKILIKLKCEKNPFINFSEPSVTFTELLKIDVTYAEIDRNGKLRHPVIEKIHF